MAHATVGDLIRAFREDERDAAEPYLWSDAQLVRFANEALIEFAIETKSLYDDSSEITRFEYVAGQQDFDLHPSIIDVVEAYAADRQLRLTAPGVVRRHELPSGNKPELLVLNRSANTIKMYPATIEPGVLELTVIRKPLAEVGKAEAIPDIPLDERRHLLLYMAHRAYNIHDADVFNPAKARDFLAEWQRACQGVYEMAMRRRASGSQAIRFRW